MTQRQHLLYALVVATGFLTTGVQDIRGYWWPIVEKAVDDIATRIAYHTVGHANPHYTKE